MCGYLMLGYRLFRRPRKQLHRWTVASSDMRTVGHAHVSLIGGPDVGGGKSLPWKTVLKVPVLT